MKIFASIALVALLSMTLAASVLGESSSESVKSGVDPAVANAIVERLRSARPDLEYTDIKNSPISGIHQVQVQNGPVLYVVNQGEYFFDGALYQVRPGMFVNLREMEKAGLRVERITSLKPDDMIIFSPEVETRAVLNVFTDVDCGYCRKLHQEVPALNTAGVEVRYLAFPRAGVGSASYKKMVSAWCAQDQKAALTTLKTGAAIEENLCEGNPVAGQYLLAAELGVSGTPAIILRDGTLIPGYRSAADFVRLLGLSSN